MKIVFKYIVFLIIALATIFTVACEQLQEDYNKPEYTNSIKIGVVGDVSVLREQVESVFFGTKLASEEINRNGGLTIGNETYPIELIFKNSGGSPTIGIDVIYELIDEGAQIIIGPTFSSVAYEMAEVCIANHVLMMTYSATTPELTFLPDNNLVWRTCPSDFTFGSTSAQYCFDSLQTRTAAIFYRDDRFGIGLSNVIKKMFVQKGGTITSSVSFPTDEPDLSLYNFDYEMNSLLKGEPDIIYIISVTSETPILINEIYNSDQYQAFVKKPYIFVNDGILPDELIKNVSTDILGTIIGISSTNIGNENYNTYKENYVNRFGFTPSTFSEHAYDAVYLVSYAMQMANSTDPLVFKTDLFSVSGNQEFLNTLNTDPITINVNEFDIGKYILQQGGIIDYDGASGPINFDLNGDPKPKIIIWGIENNQYVELSYYD